MRPLRLRSTLNSSQLSSPHTENLSLENCRRVEKKIGEVKYVVVVRGDDDERAEGGVEHTHIKFTTFKPDE